MSRFKQQYSQFDVIATKLLDIGALFLHFQPRRAYDSKTNKSYFVYFGLGAEAEGRFTLSTISGQNVIENSRFLTNVNNNEYCLSKKAIMKYAI